MYTIRRIKIGTSEPLDALALECGTLYSATVTWFWRTVRRQGIWPSAAALMRWLNSDKLHAQTADACVQAFFASLKSWRVRRNGAERRQSVAAQLMAASRQSVLRLSGADAGRRREGRLTDPQAKPPRRLRKFFRIEYKNTAIRHRDGQLILSNGQGNAPLLLAWPFDAPRTLVIRWEGEQYEAIATYSAEPMAEPIDDKTAGVDLGEVHMAVAHDGEHCTILNGRALRAKRQYQNKLKAELSSLIDRKEHGSNRQKKLIKSKRKQLRKLDNQSGRKKTEAAIKALEQA